MLLPVRMAGALVCPKRNRTDIVAAGIATVIIGFGFCPDPEAFLLGGSKPQMAVGAMDTQFFLIHGDLL